MFSQRGPTHAGGNTIKSGRSTQKKKHPMPQAQDAHDPAKEHGEAEKGFFAVRFRQNASNHSVSDLSSPERRHHSDRLVGHLTPFHLPRDCGGGWIYLIRQKNNTTEAPCQEPFAFLRDIGPSMPSYIPA